MGVGWDTGGSAGGTKYRKIQCVSHICRETVTHNDFCCSAQIVKALNTDRTEMHDGLLQLVIGVHVF